MNLSFLQGKEFRNFTKNIEEIHEGVEHLEKAFYKLLDCEKEHLLCRLAYLARQMIIVEMNFHNWDMNKPVYVNSLGSNATVRSAYRETVGKIRELALTVDSADLIINILEDNDALVKQKSKYYFFDAVNPIYKKYPVLMSIFTNGTVGYLKEAGEFHFIVYNRLDEWAYNYKITEFVDSITVSLRVEFLNKGFEEIDLNFEKTRNAESRIISECESQQFIIQERIMDNYFRQQRLKSNSNSS